MMKTSESIEHISAALATAQGQYPAIEKGRDNPFFKSKYADLSDILAACTPVLSKNGLGLIQGISIAEGRVVITSRVVHKSGQWIESELSIRPIKDDAQAMGSAATYGRRYSAEALLGVSATKDDDGNDATAASAVKKEHIVTYHAAPQQKAWLFELFKKHNIDVSKMSELSSQWVGMPLAEIEKKIGILQQ